MKSSANSVICGGCHGHMGGGRAVLTDEGVRYHLICFRCSACGTPLVGSPKVLRLQRRLMCVMCSARFAPGCVACRKPIRDPDFLYLAPGYYHADHLTCQGCGDPRIASRGLLTFGGGAPLCGHCGLARRGLVCCGCGRLIMDRFVCHGDRRWHLKCFRCGKCQRAVPLGTQRLSVVSGQLVCQMCCAVASVTARLTLAVALPAVAALIESDPSDIGVMAMSPWGQTSCQLRHLLPRGEPSQLQQQWQVLLQWQQQQWQDQQRQHQRKWQEQQQEQLRKWQEQQHQLQQTLLKLESQRVRVERDRRDAERKRLDMTTHMASGSQRRRIKKGKKKQGKKKQKKRKKKGKKKKRKKKKKGRKKRKGKGSKRSKMAGRT